MRDRSNTKRREKRRSNSRAFTLVELLIVMSIIALLIGLLLPALAQSRRSARAAQCLSKLRQHGVAFNLYESDYGALPHEDDAYHPELICWYYAVNRFLGVKDDESLNGQSEYYPEIKLCPEVDRTTPSFIKAYRFNSGLETNVQPFVKLQWISVPVATPILFDAVYTGAGLSFKGREGKVHARHLGSANILFADWHVEPVQSSEVDSLQWQRE